MAGIDENVALRKPAPEFLWRRTCMGHARGSRNRFASVSKDGLAETNPRGGDYVDG